MANLSYSFCISLLHSFWQAALLWLLYAVICKNAGNKFTPAQKRNLLFASIGVQFVLFVVSFFLYFGNYQTALTGFAVINQITDAVTPVTTGNMGPWLFTAYAAVVVFKFVKGAYSWWLFKKQFKTNLLKPSVDLKLFTASHQLQFGIKRKVQLWFSNAVNTPLTFGFWKPVIVLPVALVNQLSVQQTETLILHELAHIKANDFLLNWFVIIAENIFFFNPFILSICRQLKQEREKNCDITVTAFKYQPLVYAEALLKAQTHKQLSPVLVTDKYRIAAVNKSQHLLQRIQFFVNPANQLQPAAKRSIIAPAAAVLFVFTAVLICVMQLHGDKKQISTTALASPPVVNKALIIATTAEVLPSIANNIITTLTDDKLEKIAAAAEKHQVEIEKAVKQLEPLLIEIEKQATKFAEEIQTNIVTPVTLQEAVIEKQIVIREETSGSKNATIKVYTVIYKDGKWQLQPQWKLAAKEITSTDSLDLIDTTAPAIEEGADMQD